MGWAWFALAAGAVAAGLWRLGVPRLLWTPVAAALVLAAAGYSWVGQPFLPGKPVDAEARTIDLPPSDRELRDAFFGKYDAAHAFLLGADGLTRAGKPEVAAQLLLAGIRQQRDNAALWTGLGDAIALHDGGIVSPPALFAFEQAIRLAPLHPGPPYFLGVAYIRAGQYADAARYWHRALALTPKGSGLYPILAAQTARLDLILGMMARARR